MNKTLSELEIELLKRILEYPSKECDEILKIENPLLIHSLLLNYDWEDDEDTIINRIIDNENSDVTTILMIIELLSDSQYVYKEVYSNENLFIYKESFELCDKAFHRVLSGFYKDQRYLFKPTLNKIEIFKLKKFYPEI